MIRWIVRPGDGATVAGIVARAGGDAEAVAEGRVFVGRRRALGGDEAVRAGDEVTVAPAQGGDAAVAVVLARAGDLVAVDKPAGVPTLPDHEGATHSLLAMTARALSLPPGRLHATSRLDRGVSGVVVFALTREAAARLREARREGTYARRYVALALRAPSPPEGTWTATIGRARDPRLRAVDGRDATTAQTRYATWSTAPGGAAMMGVEPVTGRTHQIRVHAAHAGAPLLGDRDYGGPARVTLATGRVVAPGRIALHAAQVVVPGPDLEPRVVTSPVPAALLSLWADLGGDEGAWSRGATLDP